jgi:hypothetical protein
MVLNIRAYHLVPPRFFVEGTLFRPSPLPFKPWVLGYGDHGFSCQPTSHYWPLQWDEAGLYVLCALVLGAVALWAVRRWRA